jgi:16S rRNA (guanine(966)-N(2))-methyltransferase RsmD
MVASRLGALDGGAALDLYAGSGALGLEALSRGAARAVFVERDRAAARLIRQNLVSLGVRRRGQVLGLSAAAGLGLLAREERRFRLVLADPPYAEDPHQVLAAIAAAAVLEPGGLLVLEHSSRVEPPAGSGPLALSAHRVYGDSALALYA